MAGGTKFYPNCGVRIEALPPPPSQYGAQTVEKPTAAFVVSLIGGILILIEGLVLSSLGAVCGSLASIAPGGAPIGAALFLYMSIGLICGILVLIGAVMINTVNPSRVKTGSIIVLIFSIVSFFSGGGFFIGMILGIVGGILGLVWKPS